MIPETIIQPVKKREDWADYVKFIAIYLMVICHFNLSSETACKFIWIFHMPVFFLISGYFDKGKAISKNLIKKNFLTLIVPYFFFSVCNLSICWVSPFLHPECYHNGTVLQSFGKAIFGMFLMDDVVRPYAFMPCLAAWFLAALFEIRIIFSVFCYCWQKCKIIGIPLIVLLVAAVYWHFPFFSVDSAGLGLLFYVMGYLIKRYSMVNLFNKKIISFIYIVASLAYLYFFGLQNGKINIDGGEWGNSIVMFYINGLIGSLLCISIAKIISVHIHFISEIGRSTLSILGTHGFIGIVGKTLCVALWGFNPREFPLLATLLLGVCALVFGVFVHRWLTKHFPIAIGIRR